MNKQNLEKDLLNPTDKRIFVIAEAFKQGYDVEKVYQLTKIDRWFLEKLKNIMEAAIELDRYNDISSVPDELLREVKKMGFSDFQIARMLFKNKQIGTTDKEILQVRNYKSDWTQREGYFNTWHLIIYTEFVISAQIIHI